MSRYATITHSTPLAFLDHCNIDPAIGLLDWRDCAADLHGPKRQGDGLVEMGKQKRTGVSMTKLLNEHAMGSQTVFY
jgi:hypothetical protein